MARVSPPSGFDDPADRTRRDAIAALTTGYVRGEPIPHIDYTEAEHRIWQLISRELASRHATYAPRAFRVAIEQLALPTDRIPQLDEVSTRLAQLTGFRFEPVADGATVREFYTALGDDWCMSSQHIRPNSAAFPASEPDIVDGVVGYGHTLAIPGLAQLYRAAGRAAQRVETPEALDVLATVFSFSLELGVVFEAGELKAYGARILSSPDELEQFRAAEIRPLEVATMAAMPAIAPQSYNLTGRQPVLFAGRSMGQLGDVLGPFFQTFDDDTPVRLASITG